VNETITTIIMIYFALIVVFFIHEVGHLGRRIAFRKWFPYPVMASMQARFRYGGLIANTILFVGIAYYKPEIYFLQLVGLVAWIHFTLYTIFGSFNNEPKIPRWLEKYWVFDDVPNQYWFIFVPLGLTALFYFKEYYIPILLGLF